jgi:hypothetical protein
VAGTADVAAEVQAAAAAAAAAEQDAGGVGDAMDVDGGVGPQGVEVLWQGQAAGAGELQPANGLVAKVRRTGGESCAWKAGSVSSMCM